MIQHSGNESNRNLCLSQEISFSFILMWNTNIREWRGRMIFVAEECYLLLVGLYATWLCVSAYGRVPVILTRIVERFLSLLAQVQKQRCYPRCSYSFCILYILAQPLSHDSNVTPVFPFLTVPYLSALFISYIAATILSEIIFSFQI